MFAQSPAGTTGAPPAATAQKPDIEIDATVRARSVEIASEGEARIEITAQPERSSEVRVERSQPPGQASYRNVTITLHAEARIADPLAQALTAEPTGEPE